MIADGLNEDTVTEQEFGVQVVTTLVQCVKKMERTTIERVQSSTVLKGGAVKFLL